MRQGLHNDVMNEHNEAINNAHEEVDEIAPSAVDSTQKEKLSARALALNLIKACIYGS